MYSFPVSTWSLSTLSGSFRSLFYLFIFLTRSPTVTDTPSRASRLFSDTFRTNRPPPIEVMVNRGRTPEVVCQVQDHAGGFGDTIEVTLKQKRSPRRMTIVYQDDDSDSDEGDVVIKTRRAVSRHRNRRSAKHQQVEDSSSSSSSSSSSESDTFSEDTIVEKKKTKKRANAKKSQGNRKKSNKRISRNDELDEKPREAPAQAASATSLASPFLVNQCYVPTELLPTPPTSGTFAAEILHEQPGIRPVSSPHPRRAPEPEPEPTPRRPLSAFARRLGQHAPWMRFIGVKCDKSREPNHDRAHANSPTETLSSGEYRSGSSIEDYRHRCYGCDRLRSGYWQDERRPRKGEPIKPSLCGVCRHKLRGAYNKVLGPRGEDLSTLYWCRACGFRRSSRFHRQHGEPSESFSPLNSTCHICVNDQKRKREIREGKRRAIKEAGPMDNCSVVCTLPIQPFSLLFHLVGLTGFRMLVMPMKPRPVVVTLQSEPLVPAAQSGLLRPAEIPGSLASILATSKRLILTALVLCTIVPQSTRKSRALQSQSTPFDEHALALVLSLSLPLLTGVKSRRTLLSPFPAVRNLRRPETPLARLLAPRSRARSPSPALTPTRPGKPLPPLPATS